MFKLFFALPPVLLFAMLPQEPAAAPENAAPAATAALTNPVKPTPESQARAKNIYAMDCSICHGTKGNGKGDLVADMGLKMKDFTDPSTLKDRTDGDLYTIIKTGLDKEKMPAEGPRAKDEELWNLVIYVRSFSSK